jgi:putative PEP-CTERM system TPR-repeat lipoprotein
MTPFEPAPARCPWRALVLALVVAAIVAGGALMFLRQGGSVEDLRQDAAAAAAAGRHNEAVIGYKSLLQQQPKDLDARWRLGQLYLTLNQPALALKELRRAAPLREQHPELDLDVARARLALGDFREALAALGVYRGPRSGEVDALEATARASLGEVAAARDVLDKATSREPETASLHLATARLALSEQDLEGATTAVDKALAIAPDDRAALILKGRIELGTQRPADAAASFEQALTHAAADADALAGLAEALLLLQRADDAAPVVARLKKAAPKAVVTRLFEGWLAFARRDWASADVALNDVLKAAPTHPAALLMAADAAFQQDNYARTETLLTTFNKHHAGHAPAQRLLGMVLLKQRRAREAIDVLAPAAAEGEADASMFALLGQAYFEAGEIDKGEAALAQAQTLAPDSMALKTQQAIGRLLGGEGDQGVAELERLVAEAPDNAAPRQALTYLQLLGGQQEAALTSARALVDLRPDDPMALNLLGVAAAEAGDPKQARHALERALKIDRTFAPALSTLGLLEVRDGKAAEGRARLEAALAADPRHLPATLALAALANAEGRGADADAILQRAIEADSQASEPRWMLALRRLRAGQADSALRLADEALQVAPAHPRHRLLWSYVRLSAGKAEDAYAKLAALHEEAPNDASVLMLYADAARATSRHDEARQAYTAAAGRAPDAIEPWRGLFALALQQQDVPAAEAAIARLRTIGPNAPDGDAAAAALAAQQGRAADAVASLRAAFDKDSSTLRLLQLVDAQRQRGASDAARALLSNWLEQHPGDLMAREALGMVELGDGRMKEATAQFEQLLQARPDHAVALNNLAWLYDEAGDERALDMAEQAHQRLPSSPEAADTLGWILVRQGKIQRGLKLIEQAKAGLTADPTVHYHHAFALDAAGEREAALTSVLALLKQHAEFPARADAEKLRAKLLSAKAP